MTTPELPGPLHNEWQDRVLALTSRIGEPEFTRRAKLVGWVFFFAFQTRGEQPWTYAASAAIDDARASLEAMMRREPQPPATFPPEAELRSLVRGGRGLSFDQLNDRLASGPAPPGDSRGGSGQD
jgi:hypothetical protein